MTKEQRAYMLESVEYEGDVSHVFPERQRRAHDLTIKDFDGRCDCSPTFDTSQWPDLTVVHQMLPEA